MISFSLYMYLPHAVVYEIKRLCSELLDFKVGIGWGFSCEHVFQLFSFVGYDDNILDFYLNRI